MRSKAKTLQTLGKSWYEIQLSFDLALFFPRIKRDLKIKLADKLRKPDMFLPSLNLIIEYDGSYWHKNKFGTDKRKRDLFNEAGYYVCRIRETGLPLTNNKWDLPIKPTSVKNCTIALIGHLQDLFPNLAIDQNLLTHYKENKINNEAAAIEYLKDKDRSRYDYLVRIHAYMKKCAEERERQRKQRRKIQEDKKKQRREEIIRQAEQNDKKPKAIVDSSILSPHNNLLGPWKPPPNKLREYKQEIIDIALQKFQINQQP